MTVINLSLSFMPFTVKWAGSWIHRQCSLISWRPSARRMICVTWSRQCWSNARPKWPPKLYKRLTTILHTLEHEENIQKFLDWYLEQRPPLLLLLPPLLIWIKALSVLNQKPTTMIMIMIMNSFGTVSSMNDTLFQGSPTPVDSKNIASFLFFFYFSSKKDTTPS